jgi:hypothetical protein
VLGGRQPSLGLQCSQGQEAHPGNAGRLGCHALRQGLSLFLAQSMVWCVLSTGTASPLWLLVEAGFSLPHLVW